MMTFPRVSLMPIVATAFLCLGCNSSTVPPPLESEASAATVATPGTSQEEGPIITVTHRAVTVMKEIVAEQGTTSPCYLRVRVVPGGCCGFLHKLDLDPEVSPEDITFESGGVKVAVLKRQLDMLRGAQVDYGQEGDILGFKIQNPNFEGESLKKWLPVLERDKRAD